MTHDELKRITRKTLAWARTIELIDVSPSLRWLLA